MYNRILLPTDGSELAGRGVDHGLALAKALNLPVTVISVIVPLTGFALQGIVQAEAMDSYNEGRRKEIEDLEKIIGEKRRAPASSPTSSARCIFRRQSPFWKRQQSGAAA